MMLAGKPPFEGHNELEIIKKVRSGQYDLYGNSMDHVSVEAKDLLRKLLEYDPE